MIGKSPILLPLEITSFIYSSIASSWKQLQCILHGFVLLKSAIAADKLEGMKIKMLKINLLNIAFQNSNFSMF